MLSDEVKLITNLKTPEYMVSIMLISCCSTNNNYEKIIFGHNSYDPFSDRDNACITYECLGEYFETMYDESGAVQYRVWQYGGNRAGVRYPRNWTKYFCRPAVYLTSKTGKIILFLFQIRFGLSNYILYFLLLHNEFRLFLF